MYVTTVDPLYSTKSIIIESIERRLTVHQMYAESNVTSCICHGLGICALTNLSAHDVIYM